MTMTPRDQFEADIEATISALRSSSLDVFGAGILEIVAVARCLDPMTRATVLAPVERYLVELEAYRDRVARAT